MRPVAAVFVVAIFTSAFLLFLIQPMAGKLALPWFGGGPAVWNTCLLFFQVLLLGGYAWAHFGARLGHRRQMAVQAGLLLGSLALVGAAPEALGWERFAPRAGDWPVPRLLAGLAASVGLPFFVLSTNSTLAQSWLALREQREPYFLYAASNLGSLCALAAYPLLLEPRLDLGTQERWFAAGYALFALLCLVAMAVARAPASGAPVAAGALIPWPRRLRWLLCATTGSLLLCAVSLRIATDVASVPLLWTVPLALYLCTFILAFLPSAGRVFTRRIVALLAMTAITLGIVPWPWLLLGSLPRELSPPLGALFFGAWICHGDLARDRPRGDAAGRLGEFYLWLALGGALGGALSGLLAPLVWNRVAEYPLGLGLAAFVIALGAEPGPSERRDGVVFAAISVGVLGGAAFAIRFGGPDLRALAQAAPLLLLAAGIVQFQRRWRFALAAGLVALFAVLGLHDEARVLAQHRDFFGVLRIVQGPTQRRMMHGTTEHGVQVTAPPTRAPGSYYHPQAPMGRLVAGATAGARIGVVGLGTGALAALTRPGQTLRYYELDPMVEALARRWFTFLGDAQGRIEVQIGDARLTLAGDAASGAERFDLLIIDAFSSDAVPVHLLTDEALALYRARLAPGGLLALHVSNRYLDLARVLRAGARTLGVAAAIARYLPDEAAEREGAAPSTVIALGDPARLAALPGFAPLEAGPSVSWTDRRSSLLDVLADAP